MKGPEHTYISANSQFFLRTSTQFLRSTLMKAKYLKSPVCVDHSYCCCMQTLKHLPHDIIVICNHKIQL